jgi:hypothetical protein
MNIQRHVRQDFQPVYIKLEDLDEIKDLVRIMGQIVREDLTGDQIDMIETITCEMENVIVAGGIYP